MILGIVIWAVLGVFVILAVLSFGQWVFAMLTGQGKGWRDQTDEEKIVERGVKWPDL